MESAFMAGFLVVSILPISCSDDDEPQQEKPVSITTFSPGSGVVGTAINISGQNFSSVANENIVAINGAAAEVSAASSNEITVILPPDATTGKISVTTGGKTATSQNDFVVPLPTIESWTPEIAGPGRTVVITGTNFSLVPSENIVKFNGTAAEVSNATATELEVVVPEGGSTGVISVRVGPHTVTSTSDFEVCVGAVELLISDVTVSNVNSSSYTVSFSLTNVGSIDADLSKFNMQNYASTDAAYGGADLAASGYTLASGNTLSPGSSHQFTFSGTVVGGTVTSHPYLIVTINGSVDECNTDNNIVITHF